MSTKTARHSQSRFDLSWTIYDTDDGSIWWHGYDDANWWNNVSGSDGFRVRVGKVSGRRYVLDPNTNAVEIEDGAIVGGAA